MSTPTNPTAPCSASSTPLTDKLDAEVRQGDSLSAYFMMRTHAQTMEKESAQNWRFFEVAAANHQQTMENANALLWAKMEWESIAHELAGFVKSGWEDADAALARFEAANAELWHPHH